jgi:pSer/pThr/pTyr-binding forkhead associated (FHA) protein
MTLKGWMLGKVNTTEKRDARSRAPTAKRGEATAATEPHEPSLGAFGERGATLAEETEHLGPYRPLIAAIREELEQFATSQLRLHLAIAERDRYVLASIEVECEGSDEQRDLMRRFVREFRPEQIKSYLAKEVIAGLRNASAIDLSQFAGLNAESESAGSAGDEERYGELIAELASGMPRSAARPYRVTLVGRWSELDATAPAADGKSPRRAGPRTPLAARALALDIEDAGGARRFELASVLPGRRYAIGKGEDCDIVVDGVYASRRHCEIWIDKGAWWVADTGSTNGIRVESAAGVIAREPPDARAAARKPAIELQPGTWLVLAAHVQGEPRQYPRLSLRPADAPVEAKRATPQGKLASTPVTPIAAPRRRERVWTITARMASGAKSLDLREGALPFRVGRSRNQALVIDWAHADVSGRHFEIVAVDESGATVVVHGDNGVTVDGAFHGPGAEFRWKSGQTLHLGHATGEAAACAVTLSRA